MKFRAKKVITNILTSFLILFVVMISTFSYAPYAYAEAGITVSGVTSTTANVKATGLDKTKVYKLRVLNNTRGFTVTSEAIAPASDGTIEYPFENLTPDQNHTASIGTYDVKFGVITYLPNVERAFHTLPLPKPTLEASNVTDKTVTLKSTNLVAGKDYRFKLKNTSTTRDLDVPANSSGTISATIGGLTPATSYTADIYLYDATAKSVTNIGAPTVSFKTLGSSTTNPPTNTGNNSGNVDPLDPNDAVVDPLDPNDAVVDPLDDNDAKVDPFGNSTKIKNPINIKNLNGFIKTVLENVIKIAIPLIAFALIYSGFLYVSARGNSEKIETAHKALLYTMVGAGLVLGSWAIAQLISNTVLQL